MFEVSSPPVATRVRVGKNAAFAVPICALAEATRRSAAAMSGRRSRSWAGSPTGIMGGPAAMDADGSVNSAGGFPIRIAIACSSCARPIPRSIACARAVSSCVCA